MGSFVHHCVFWCVTEKKDNLTSSSIHWANLTFLIEWLRLMFRFESNTMVMVKVSVKG